MDSGRASSWSRKTRFIVVLLLGPILAGLCKILSTVLFALAFFIIWLKFGDNYNLLLPFWARHLDIAYIGLPILSFVEIFISLLKWASNGARPVAKHK